MPIIFPIKAMEIEVPATSRLEDVLMQAVWLIQKHGGGMTVAFKFNGNEHKVYAADGKFRDDVTCSRCEHTATEEI